MKKAILLFSTILIIFSSISGCVTKNPGRDLLTEAELAYNEALLLIDAGKYAEAQDKLRQYVGYKDIDQMLDCFIYKCDQEIKHMTYYLDDGSEYASDARYEYEYDRYGNMTLVKMYSDDDQLSGTYEYRYDDCGRMTHQLVYGTNGELNKTYLVEYDEYGSVTMYSILDSRGDTFSSTQTYSYEYDENGWVLSKSQYYSSGSLAMTEKWEYDERGNKTLYLLYRGNLLTTKETFAYTYDEYDRLKTIDHRNDLGSLLESVTYSYDANGNLIHMRSRDGNGAEEKTAYNIAGQITKLTCSDNRGTVYLQDVNEYDDNGNVITKIRYGDGGAMVYKYEYAYDQYGNVIQEIRYNKDGNKESHYEFQYTGVKLYYNPFLK